MQRARQAAENEKPIAILRFIADYRRAHGWAPTVREIGAEIGMSAPSQVKYYLDQLVKRQLIVRESGAARCVRLTGHGRLLIEQQEDQVHAAV